MLSDPSAIALIVGAIAIVGFLVHGLWFSGRPTNRKLNAKNHDDEQLLKQSDVAKVRIVSRDRPVFKKEPAGESRSVPESLPSAWPRLWISDLRRKETGGDASRRRFPSFL